MKAFTLVRGPHKNRSTLPELTNLTASFAFASFEVVSALVFLAAFQHFEVASLFCEATLGFGSQACRVFLNSLLAIFVQQHAIGSVTTSIERLCLL